MNEEKRGRVTSFDLGLCEESIQIKPVGESEYKTYTLRELTGGGRDVYMKRMSSQMEMTIGRDGKATGRMKDMSGLNTFMLSLTLYDPEGRLVPIEILNGWPSHVVTSLSEIASELSSLDDGAEEDAKND